MSSVNKVFLLGNIGQPPEIRYTPDGSPVASMSLATSTYSGKGDNKKEYTEWHNCVAFNEAARFIEQYIHKGSKVHIEGSLRTNKWEDKDGNKRSKVEVVVGRITALNKVEGEKTEKPQSPPTFDDLDDDIPY